MIVRRWTGFVPGEKAPAYLSLMRDIAIRDYRDTPGNLGAWCLHRAVDHAVEVQMLTFWESKAAIEAFAGKDIAKARYYDFDPAYLIAMPPEVDQYEVLAGQASPAGLSAR